jgi:hypothetical protein
LQTIVVSQFVSEQELADTYDSGTGWETVTQYREATRLREENPNMARAEISRRVGRPASAIRGWLAEDKTPRVVTGLQTAHQRGWIDVNAESERFRALNQLVAWIYSGGGMSVDTFAPHFSVDDPLALGVLGNALRWLNIDYRCREPDSEEGHVEVVPSEGASVLGRVLTVLGAPRGVKAAQDSLSLPAYLSDVDPDLQRDFARIYLLNRGRHLTDEDTVEVHSMPSAAFARKLKTFFDSVTSAEMTIGTQNRLWVPVAAVREVAGGSPVRSALATAVSAGSLTPPTERAVADTFRRTESPSGYRYTQLYNIVCSSDGSSAALARETGIPEPTVQSWRRERTPPAVNALQRARELGWIAPTVESDTSLHLTSLVAWVIAHGTLRETYYPIFRTNTAAQCERFERLADGLGVPYGTVGLDDPNRSTEHRPSENGTTLGRVLYALGATRPGDVSDTLVLPPYLFHYPRQAQRFIEIWVLHHGDGSDPVRMAIPPRFGSHFTDGIEGLLVELSWDYERVDQETFEIARKIQNE